MKAIVAHPAQQHSYRLAAALAHNGMLYKYATTVYCAKGSLTALAAALLRGRFRQKAKSRKCPDLCDGDVLRFCEAGGLIKLLAMNVPLFRPFYRRLKYGVADRFAKKTAAYAIKHGVDAVICYDDYSAKLFEILKEKAPGIVRIMDASAAYTVYMRSIYERDFLLMPEFASELRMERKVVWDEAAIERAQKEAALADHIIAASGFTKRSFVECGVPESKVSVCPYGVDTDLFAPKKPGEFHKAGEPVRFIYVGGVKQLKGIGYLLKAFEDVDPGKATLTVVGSADNGQIDLSAAPDCVTFSGSVLHGEVPALLKAADVFVFPSLGDGFSLAVLEAAACSLPVIVSDNTGACDLIENGTEGFVIPVQSSEAIAEKVNWFIEHPESIKPMGTAARRLAEKLTWENYEQGIRRVFERRAWENGSNN